MSVNFTSLVAQPNAQLEAPAESISVIPLTAISPTSNGCLAGVHPEKTTIMDAVASREIVMHSRDANIDGMLDITLHHASDIHNICIYGKQDVYAKFSITQAQDTVYSTQPVRGGGKNPIFNQSLQILISKLDAVLKCELWMMSCARNYLEDQLLGFVLVPLCDLLGKGNLMRDYSLTSTELFHTPAGTVCLSLMFYNRCAQPLLPAMVSDVSELDRSENGMGSYAHTVGDDRKHDNVKGWDANIAGKEEKGLPIPVDYDSIEFPDLQAASENQQLVSMYMKMVSDDSNMDDIPNNGGDSEEQIGVISVIQVPAHARENSKDISERHVRARGAHDSKLELGTSSLEGDCEMALNNGEEEKYDEGNGNLACGAPYNMHMKRNGELPSPTSTGSGHQPNIQTRGASASKEETSDHMKSKAFNNSECSSNSQATPSPTSISSAGLSSSDDKMMGSLDGQESASSFTDPPPIVSISLDPEVPVVQQQIVDMYMKSMQQFTESLAKMKLPFDMEGTTQSSSEHSGELQQRQPEKKGAPSEPVVKDGHRVFYGSRAFF